MAPAESLMVKNPSRPVARAGQGLSSDSHSSQKQKGLTGMKDRAADGDHGPLQAQPDAGACCNTTVDVLSFWLATKPIVVVASIFLTLLAHQHTCLQPVECFCCSVTAGKSGGGPCLMQLHVQRASCACMLMVGA